MAKHTAIDPIGYPICDRPSEQVLAPVGTMHLRRWHIAPRLSCIPCSLIYCRQIDIEAREPLRKDAEPTHSTKLWREDL